MTQGLPVLSGAELVRLMERAGWEQAGHASVPVPLHQELKRGTLSGTLRQADISRELEDLVR